MTYIQSVQFWAPVSIKSWLKHVSSCDNRVQGGKTKKKNPTKIEALELSAPQLLGIPQCTVRVRSWDPEQTHCTCLNMFCMLILPGFFQVGERLARYDVEKRCAIEKEDYDLAKKKKELMEDYRKSVYQQLEVHNLLDMAMVRLFRWGVTADLFKWNQLKLNSVLVLHHLTRSQRVQSPPQSRTLPPASLLQVTVQSPPSPLSPQEHSRRKTQTLPRDNSRTVKLLHPNQTCNLDHRAPQLLYPK